MKIEATGAEVTVARKIPAVLRKAAKAEAMEISAEENSKEEIMRTISRSMEGENRRTTRNQGMNPGKKEKRGQLATIK